MDLLFLLYPFIIVVVFGAFLREKKRKEAYRTDLEGVIRKFELDSRDVYESTRFRDFRQWLENHSHGRSTRERQLRRDIMDLVAEQVFVDRGFEEE